MANISEVLMEQMVNSFTDANQLVNFAATCGLQDLVVVGFRLFQLNTQNDDTFVTEQLDALLQTFGGETEQSFNMKMEEEVKESKKHCYLTNKNGSIRT